MLHKHTITVYLLLTLGLAGYLLPWIVAPTAPMTLNAYDLAEWTSLHPIQLGAPLAVPLLLRSQLPVIAVWIALPARGPLMRLLAAAGVMLLALAQLPPLEFLTISRHDSNYQQQFMLRRCQPCRRAARISLQTIPTACPCGCWPSGDRAAFFYRRPISGAAALSTLMAGRPARHRDRSPGFGVYRADCRCFYRLKLAQPANGWLQ